MLFLLFLSLGAVAGVLAGLLGLGGGIVIVPTLLLVFASLGFDEAVRAQLAVGSSLATICFTSLGAVYSHHRRGAVLWPWVMKMAPGIVCGALTGAAVADALPGLALEGLFGVFAIVIAMQMILTGRPQAASTPAAPERALPGWGLVLAGALIGTASSLFGIGGGSLTVPFLSWARVTMARAVATASACGWPIALAGALGFAWLGRDENLPDGSVGYLYLPAVVAIVISAIPFAAVGAKWAHRVPAHTLKKIFAAVLLVIGARLLSGLM